MTTLTGWMMLAARCRSSLAPFFDSRPLTHRYFTVGTGLTAVF
jgi:hypothetical protein